MGKCFICRTVFRKAPKRNQNQTDQLLDNEVSVIFILQKLLDIPSAVCVDVISSNGNPSTWLSFCNFCTSFLQETKTLFSKAMYFQKKFEMAKMEFKNNVQTTLKDRELTNEKYLKDRNQAHIPDYFISLYFKDHCELESFAVFDSIIVKKEEYLEDYDLSGDQDEKEQTQNDWMNEKDIESNDYENILDTHESESKDEDWHSNENQSSDNEAESAEEDKLPQQKDASLNDQQHLAKENPTKFQCAYCDYSCRYRVSWKVHTRRHHTKETPYSCELCDAKFCGRKDVYNHFRKAHRGKKPTPMVIRRAGKSRNNMTLNAKNKITKLDSPRQESDKLKDEDCYSNNNKSSDNGAESVNQDQLQQNNASLDDHQRIAKENPMKFQCIYCDYSSRHRVTWKVHTRRHHTKETPYSCELCDAKFSGRKDVYNHFRKAHPGKKPTPMVTRRAGKSSNNMESNAKNIMLKLVSPKHESKGEDFHSNENHSSVNAAETVKQDQLFQQNDASLNEQQPATESPVKFQCNYCDFSFKHRVSWKVHTRRQHTKETPYSCELCDEKFFGRKDVYNHFKKAHPGKKPTPMVSRCAAIPKNKSCNVRKKPRSSEFVCKLCGRDCKGKATYDTHMNYHKKEKTISCDLCSEKFYNVTVLSWHQRSMHYKELNLEPFQCKECGKMLSGPRNLERHMISRHTKKFDFICENCGAGFVDKAKLLYHMRTQHDLEKPFECPICFEKLVSRTRVNEHVQMHTGKYEHVCTVCEKGFTSISELKRHMKYHSSDFPHKRKSRLASKVKNPLPPNNSEEKNLPTLETILPMSNSMQQRVKCGLRKYPFSIKSKYDY